MSSTVSEDSHLNALDIVKIELIVYIDRGCLFFELLIRQGQKHTFLPKHASDWLPPSNICCRSSILHSFVIHNFVFLMGIK